MQHVVNERGCVKACVVCMPLCSCSIGLGCEILADHSTGRLGGAHSNKTAMLKSVTQHTDMLLIKEVQPCACHAHARLLEESDSTCGTDSLKCCICELTFNRSAFEQGLSIKQQGCSSWTTSVRVTPISPVQTTTIYQNHCLSLCSQPWAHLVIMTASHG